MRLFLLALTAIALPASAQGRERVRDAAVVADGLAGARSGPVPARAVSASPESWRQATGTDRQAAGVQARATPASRNGFPHARHAKLFPTCEGCHSGIVSGRADRVMPTVAQCEACHNGRDTSRVSWTPPVRPVEGLLKFSHTAHAADVDSTGRACSGCHNDAGALRMDVRGPRADGCFTCHTHRAVAHYDESNRCATCHVPLTRAASLTRAKIDSLPLPSSHRATEFIAGHGAAGKTFNSCQTCHARESCVRCHMNGAAVIAIASLARDARVAAAIRTKPAVYPRPTTHDAADFATGHGAAARGASACASCHARPSCRSCHIGGGAARVIDALPLEPTRPGEGRGVQLKREVHLIASAPSGAEALATSTQTIPVADTGARVVRVHPSGFERHHAGPARAGAMTCEGCHTQASCAQCHAGERSRRYHVANFAMRHASDAYARETNCASCHNAEVFCRSCHRQNGVGSRGTTSGVFHTAQPEWLLQHSRAARQNLATCATCHQQRDCMQCHSTLGWGVSPHGPGFDAARMWKQAKPMCLRCHLSDPFTS